jgi:membrane protease YdiL (CAAX protease family)
MTGGVPTEVEPRSRHASPLGRALGAVVLTMVVVSLASYLLPEDYESAGVALGFLGMTYLLVLRRDDTGLIRHHGLSLGGVLEPEAIDVGRIGRDATRALAWGVGLALLCLPPFWLGYLWWWKPAGPFLAAPLGTLGEDLLGQLVVIALPEEAFYRGYLQTALDDVWRPRWRLLGAPLGWGIVATSAVFALGHLVTEPHPNRLAVFFPALVFGWLRCRTGGIGAAVAFHALCNLFSSYLERSYGLGS